MKLNNYLPCRFDVSTNKINICLNYIESEQQLKENLEREIIFANFFSQQGGDYYDKVVRGYSRGCERSLRNYFKEKELLFQATQICLKNSLIFGDFNKEGVPFDSWVRFVNFKIRTLSEE